MPNTILGKVSATPKGAWSSSTAYERLDIVSNGGNSYLALQNVPSGTALSNTSYWLVIAEKGDKGDKGNTGATGATGATGNGISSVEVEETSVSGSVHTCLMTISFTDGTSYTYEYEVTDGNVTSVNGATGAVDLEDLLGLSVVDGKLNITYEV